MSPWVTMYLPLISTVVVAAATVVLVWLTSRYVRLTQRMVDETQKSREPAVTLDFEMPDGEIRMVVENHGLSPARNVQITILKDAQLFQFEKEIRCFADIWPIKEGISYLTPSRKLKYYLGFQSFRNTTDEQMVPSFRITYENEGGKKYEHTVVFDFRQMRKVLYESFKDPSMRIAEAIKEFERDIQLRERSRQLFGSLGIPKTKTCPMCAEKFPLEARKCSHCQELQEKTDYRK